MGIFKHVLAKDSTRVNILYYRNHIGSAHVMDAL